MRIKLIAVIFLMLSAFTIIGCSKVKENTNSYSGTVEANKILIQTEETALVDKIHIDKGEKTSKNHSLVTLDTEKINLKLEEAKHAIDIANAQKKEAEASGRKELIQQAEGTVKQAEINEELLLLQKERASIKSPVSGTIQDVYITEGELANSGENLLSIIDHSIKEVVIFVPEKELNKVEKGQAIDMTTSTYSNKTFTGKIKTIATEAQFTPKNIQTEEETAKRVFAVTIDISTENELKTGMTVHVEL